MYTSRLLRERRNTHEFGEKGLSGLHNNGNTCFLNSVIQCLSNTKLLLECILKDEYKNDIHNLTRSLLVMRFAGLIQNIWGDHQGSLNTYSFKSAFVIYAPRFSGFNQHDAQEFFRYLLAGLHEELNQAKEPKTSLCDKSKYEIIQKNNSLSAEETWQRYLQTDNSKIVQIFGGLLRSVLTCTICGFTSTVFEPFWDLSLPIPSNNRENPFQQINLNHCLDFFTKEERLDGNERPTCSRCQSKQICTKRILIERLPQVLVINLKRFSNEAICQKVNTIIDYPMVGLNVSAYVAGSSHKNVLYNLYGIINHYGSCQYGHYTACCKHPYSGIWHQFDDTLVTELSIDQTTRLQAYILFYEIDKTTMM